MITKLIHKTMLLAAICLGCISCSDETSLQQAVPDNSNGQVKIMYRIAGSSPLSRAETTPEPGWSGDWHENLITRIDLFVFNEGTTDTDPCYKHIEVSAGQGESLSDKADEYEPLPTNELTYEEVSEGNYTYYMVANCPQLAGQQNITLAQLRQEMIEMAIVLNEKQDLFVMDGEGVRTDTNDGQTITLSFDLARAAVKICLTVNDKDGKSILNQCKYSFQNYVTAGTSVMKESEAYGEGTDQNRRCMERNADETFSLTYDTKAVFYSYPNDWFDESLLNEGGTFTDPEIYAKDDLIDEEKQTYILLKAPFTNEDNITNESYYKVPVNFTIADYNDKVSFSKDEIETLRDDYYRMKRNYIYDITVTIDHEGGTYLDPEELKNLVLKVNPWEKEDITVNYTDELSYTNGGWDNQTLLTPYPNENNTIVHINPEEPAVFRFTIQSPNTATWRAQLTGDVDAFRFVDGINSGSVQYDDEDNAVQQELKIEAVYPGSEERFEAQLHFYADIAGKTYELDLTNKSTSPIEPSEPDESTQIPYFTILQSK